MRWQVNELVIVQLQVAQLRQRAQCVGQVMQRSFVEIEVGQVGCRSEEVFWYLSQFRLPQNQRLKARIACVRRMQEVTHVVEILHTHVLQRRSAERQAGEFLVPIVTRLRHSKRRERHQGSWQARDPRFFERQAGEIGEKAERFWQSLQPIVGIKVKSL